MDNKVTLLLISTLIKKTELNSVIKITDSYQIFKAQHIEKKKKYKQPNLIMIIEKKSAFVHI